RVLCCLAGRAAPVYAFFLGGRILEQTVYGQSRAVEAWRPAHPLGVYPDKGILFVWNQCVLVHCRKSNTGAGRRHPRRDPFKIHSPILMTSRFCQRPSVNPRRPSEDQSSRAEPSSIISLADFANTCWSIKSRRQEKWNGNNSILRCPVRAHCRSYAGGPE